MRWVPTFAALFVSLLAACADSSSGESSSSREITPSRERASVRNEWITIDGVDFPAVMAEAPVEIVEAYVFAAKHPEVLSYMPCYCGCQNESPPHVSNYDCFVDAIDTSGPRPRVDPDPMGFG